MWTRSGLTVVLLLVAAACVKNPDSPPLAGPANTEPTQPPPPPPVSTVPVLLRGAVIDADREEPIAGAFVKVKAVNPSVPFVRPPDAWSTTTDARGAFEFAADLPGPWKSLTIEGSRTGYEPSLSVVFPATATFGLVKLQPRLTIRPGESLKTRLFSDGYGCYGGWFPCRLVVLESGDLVDIEVIPAVSNAQVGLQAGASADFPYPPLFNRRITIAGGEFALVGPFAEDWTEPFMWVTLTATRRSVSGR